MMNLNEKNPAEILHETREYIEKNGWWRGSLLGPNKKQACIVGGMLLSQGYSATQLITGATPEPEWLRRTKGYVADAICHPSVEEWNDDYAGSKQEVLDALDKATKIALGLDPAAL